LHISKIGNLPNAFFSYKGIEYHNKKWLQKHWDPLRKQAAVQARKDELRRMVASNGKPCYIHGVPVFLANFPRIRGIPLGSPLGTGVDGMLIVEARPSRLDPRDREAVAWHEFGEIFSHQTGNAFMYSHLTKTGQLDAFLNRNPYLRKELDKIKRNWEKRRIK